MTDKEKKVSKLVSAILDLIRAEISYQVDEHDIDSMGSYYAEKELKELLMEILP